MSQIEITINSRVYNVACEDGQEEHLQKLASFLDERVGELSGAVGQVGDARLLVMTGLLVADELSDAYAELERLRAEVKAQGDAPSAPAPDPAAEAARDEATAAMLETMATRINTLAESLEKDTA